MTPQSSSKWRIWTHDSKITVTNVFSHRQGFWRRYVCDLVVCSLYRCLGPIWNVRIKADQGIFDQSGYMKSDSLFCLISFCHKGECSLWEDWPNIQNLKAKRSTKCNNITQYSMLVLLGLNIAWTGYSYFMLLSFSW